MKTALHTSLLILALCIPAGAAIGPIHMDIEQINKSKSEAPAQQGKGKGGGKPTSKTQTRALKIRLQNNSGETFDNLVVRYWFMGHDASSPDIKILKQGEAKASLGPRAKALVESEEASVTSSDAKPAAKAAKGGYTPPAKPSGQKLSGYAVRVLNGGNVEAEYYSETSYKEKIGDKPAPVVGDAKKGRGGKKK